MVLNYASKNILRYLLLKKEDDDFGTGNGHSALLLI